MKESQVYLQIAINDKVIGKIIIELYKNQVYHTCYNFESLCTGLYGKTYKNTYLHKLVKNKYIQGGQLFHSIEGVQSSSIFKYTQFNNENFLIQPEIGTIAMVSDNRYKNGSQFLIITGEDGLNQFNNQLVAFGKVIDGMDVIKRIEQCKVKENLIMEKVKISDCGLI